MLITLYAQNGRSGTKPPVTLLRLPPCGMVPASLPSLPQQLPAGASRCANLNKRRLRPDDFPLIQELIWNHPLPYLDPDSSDPSAWLSTPVVSAIFARHFPAYYFSLTSTGMTMISPEGDLIVWGNEKRGKWCHCVDVTGLGWKLLARDLQDIFKGHAMYVITAGTWVKGDE